MKQLAKLAQAIVHGPKLLILDEPTNGLDPPARQRMIRLIREMTRFGRSAHRSLLAPAARRRRDLRRGADSEAGPHRALLESRRGAAGQPQFVELETVGDETARLPEHSRSSGLRMRHCWESIASKWFCPKEFEIRDLYRLAAERETCRSGGSITAATRLEDIFLKAMESELAGKGSVNGRL